MDESLGAALRLPKVERFRSPQLEVLLAALRGESILLVSATGSGKSLCFQIPILLSRGTGFVISPPKALTRQQVEGLQSRQIPGTFINGDLSPQEKALRYKLLRAGVFESSSAPPSGSTRPCCDRRRSRRSAARARASSWSMKRTASIAGAEIRKRIFQSLGIPDARVIVTGVNRSNVALARLPDVCESVRFKLITRLLAAMPAGRAMIFLPIRC